MATTGSCPICFEDLKNRETASPDVCHHVFCLFCLQKWSKHGSYCPVDRQRFKNIIDLSTGAPIQIKHRKRKKKPELYDISVHCEVCKKANAPASLLLCDCCDLGFHCKCLTPPLMEIPQGPWNCPMCVAVAEKIKLKKGISKDVENIFRDHTNWDSSSSVSSESNAPETLHSQPKTNTDKKSSTISSDSCASTSGIYHSKHKAVIPEASKDTEASSSRRILRKRKSSKLTVQTAYTYPSKNRNEKLISLRPRKILRDKCADSDISEDDTEDENKPDSSSKITRSYNKLKRLRSQMRVDKVQILEVSSSSEDFEIPRKKRFVLKSSSENDNSVGLPASPTKPLDLRSYDRKNDKLKMKIQETFSINKITSETITSPLRGHNNDSNESTHSGICWRQNTSSSSHPLEMKIQETVPKSKITSETITRPLQGPNSDSNESTHSGICGRENTSSSSHLKDEYKKTVDFPLDPQNEKMHMDTVEVEDSESFVPGILPENEGTGPSTLTFENISFNEDDILVLDRETAVSGGNKENSNTPEVNAGQNDNYKEDKKVKVFSVFQKLEDTSSSQKRYYNISLAVKEDGIYRQDESVSVKAMPNTANTQQTFKDNFRIQKNDYVQRAKNLHKGLQEIEKEKWKTYHLRTQKSTKSPCKLQCCSSKNASHDHTGDVVQVGRHFHHSKYSDNFNKFKSIIESSERRSRWKESDTVILRRNSYKSPACKPFIHTLCPISKSIRTIEEDDKVDGIKNLQNPRVISIGTENLLQYRENDNALLRAVFCLDDAKHLAIRKDGSIFVDWCSS